MKQRHTSLFILFVAAFCQIIFSQTPPRRVYTTTPTYSEIISKYESLAKQSTCCKLLAYGTTDVGKPLHVFVVSKTKEFDPAVLKKQNKRILLINNGIHPGEPDGIDASIEMVNTLINDESKIPNDVVICIIPIYNIDGCLNRGKYSRVNQNGPEEYGFRGNAQNLDLNRDFIKADSENALTFSGIFQTWKPDVFMDNHVSNGADYQYVMTLISTQRDKLQPLLSKYMTEEMVPQLFSKMKVRHCEMSPYVDCKEENPESGLIEFIETPRFSSGYAALFNCISFIPETHMWKPYNDRVWSTYELMFSMIEVIQKDAKRIGLVRSEADAQVKMQRGFVLNWQLDTMKFDTLLFKGYKAQHKVSTISGLPRLYYDRSEPYSKWIRFYNHYKPSVKVSTPTVYIIPQAWIRVIDRLKVNGVEMKQLVKDSSIACEVKYIISYESPKNPYEGHYVHHNTRTRTERQVVNFYKGDYIIKMDQVCNRYIVETLEPEGDDSFFAWNFFDAILQQKEGFSDYIFEEKAEEILKETPVLKEELDANRRADTAFAKNHRAQLDFIYKHSSYYEKSHNRYPVFSCR
jgi:Zinc carboxypeptidase